VSELADGVDACQTSRIARKSSDSVDALEKCLCFIYFAKTELNYFKFHQKLDLLQLGRQQKLRKKSQISSLSS
jgi:hypothetical protein